MLQPLIYPLPLTIGLVLLGTLLSLRSHRFGTTLVLLALAFLWAVSTEPVASRLAGALENSHPPVAAPDLPTADAIVILGGGVRAVLPPRVEPQLGRAGDRARMGQRLYLAGRAPVVVVSGGTLPQTIASRSEAMATAELLQDWGVPANAIESLGQMQSTRDEAVHVVTLMEEQGHQRILLVTSATHMPRALATFRTVGIDAIPTPADHIISTGAIDSAPPWVPTVSRLDATTRAWHEYAGMAWYRYRGWIE